MLQQAGISHSSCHSVTRDSRPVEVLQGTAPSSVIQMGAIMVDATSNFHRPEANFLDAGAHQDFRTCMELSAALDTLLPCIKPQTPNTLLTENPGAFQSMLNTHAQVLRREDDEVCAIIGSNAGFEPRGNNDEVLKIRDPRILIAVNADSSGHHSNRDEPVEPLANSNAKNFTAGVKDSNKYRKSKRAINKCWLLSHLSAITTPSWLKTTEQSTSSAQHKDEKKRREAQVDLAHSPHQIRLIKVDRTGCASLTEDALTKVFADLDRRVPFQDHVQSYFRYLSSFHTAETATARAAAEAQLQFYIFGTCHQAMERRFAIGEAVTPDDRTVNLWEILTRLHMPAHAASIVMPHELVNKTTDAKQATAVATAFEVHSAYGNISIYTTHADRLRFQGTLQLLLLRARRALQDLGKYVHDSSRSEGGFKKRVIIAQRRMKELRNFLNFFNEFLESHLEWLAECANVVDFRDTPTWTTYSATAAAQATQTAPNPQRAGALDRRATDDDTIDHLSFIQQTGSLEGRPYKAFAATAIAYMHLFCLHATSLQRVTMCRTGHFSSSLHHESAIIAQAQVGIVHLGSRKRDDAPFAGISKAFLADLTALQKQLRPDFLHEHLGEIVSLQVKSDTTPHCESLLMSLVALVNDPKIMKSITSQWLEQNGILATPSDLTDMLGFPNGMVIDVLKKNCTPCEAARWLTGILGYNKGCFIPPQNSRCFTAGLPTIMPKKLAEPILDWAKYETAAKLLQWQKLLDARGPEENRKSHISSYLRAEGDQMSPAMPAPMDVSSNRDTGTMTEEDLAWLHNAINF